MRRGKKDWLDLGLRLLHDEGEGALTLERLCQEMALTRGSFYHHFRNVAAYRAALLERWLDTLTELPIRRTESAPDPLGELGTLVAGLDHALDLAFRAWGQRDAGVGEAVAAVDARRVAHLTALYTRAGQPRAAARAELTYAVFVGTQTLGWAGRASLRELFGQALDALAARTSAAAGP